MLKVLLALPLLALTAAPTFAQCTADELKQRAEEALAQLKYADEHYFYTYKDGSKPMRLHKMAREAGFTAAISPEKACDLYKEISDEIDAIFKAK